MLRGNLFLMYWILRRNLLERVGRCPHRLADLPEDSNFLGQSHRNRPAEFARSSLSAWGLPTPVVALACTCSVGSLRCHLCRRSSFLNTAFASLQLQASPERGDSPRGGEMPAGQRESLSMRGTSEAGGGVFPLYNSPQQPTGFTKSYASFFLY